MTHNAERGLFELGRGRPVYVASGADDGSARAGGSAAVAAVEGLDRSTLDRLEGMADGGIRLIVTRQRARSMVRTGGGSLPELGVDPPPATSNGKPFAGVRLPLGRAPAPEDVVRLASAIRTPAPESLDPLPPEAPEAAALELVRHGGLLPAVVSVRATPEDSAELAAALESGAMLRVPASEIGAFTAASPAAIRRVTEAPVPLGATEEARFVLFREQEGLREHLAIAVGERETWPDPVPVRLHSACLTGDLFGSLRCDCGEQLRASLRIFAARGGVLLYLAQEGRSIGLANKLRAYAIQEDDLDTVEANCTLGFGADERRYGAAVEILRRLGVERVQLLTNNPEKLRAVEEGGIRVVERRSLHGTLNRHNLPYVATKARRIGHWLDEMLSSELPEG